MPLEHAAGGHAREREHQLDGIASGHADDAAVGVIEIPPRDVVAQRGLARGMEADRHSELFDGLPQRLELRVVHVPTVDRVGVADDGDGAELAHRASRLARGEHRIVEGDLGGELQPRGRVLAVLVRPVVVRARQRVGHARVEVVVHLHLTAARAVEDRDVDALDVHRLHVRRRIVTARVRDLVVRRACERAALQFLAHGGGVRPLRHLADLEVADADERLVRRVVGAPREDRRERLERLVEVAHPEVVGLHRVQIAVHDLEPVLHYRFLRVDAS
jgi:hypothetical protein